MARLIDADAIIDFIDMGHYRNPLETCFSERDVVDMLEGAPTVDAVKVVRCRDCKWYMPGDLFTDIMFCHRLKKENGKPAKYNYSADDFCSYGERKDGDD